ncbi:uncharacterized protein LOC117644253 [Thrips palmi]|uniref:Uncharacterized protein LOC117644253 n=1 Tax=Thrips palmi TaxID=161013 RepID=A0A6P8YQ65_THRPL|nr:uncharacterized protein LOC117644253 [Thrips palmi]
MASWWCEDDWMYVKAENLTGNECFGRHALVRAPNALERQFQKDVNQLGSFDLLPNLDQFHDSEIVHFLRLLGSGSKVNVILEQGDDIFNAEWTSASNLGSNVNGIEQAETLLVRVLVAVLAARGIMRKPVADQFSNSSPRDVWWCEEHWIKIENVLESNCYGMHSVLRSKNSLFKQFKRDMKALSNLQPLQKLLQLGDDEVMDGLHLLGCESVNCKVTLQHEDDTFSAEWCIPTNSVLKSSPMVSNCATCGIVLAETVLGRVLVEVLTIQGLLHKQNMVESSSEPLCLTTSAGISPTSHQLPDSPCSSITLLNEDEVHCTRQPHELNYAPRWTPHIVSVTSTSSDPASDSVHDPFLNSIQFEEEEKVRIHDTLMDEESMDCAMEQEPMDTATPQTPVKYSLSIKTERPKPYSRKAKPASAKNSLKIPNRARMMAISLKGPQDEKMKAEKAKVLQLLESEENISNLSKLSGLRCNMDVNWSAAVLKRASKCKKLHHVEVLWPRREHWYLIQELCLLRRLEIYANEELYENENPPTVMLPKTHALRVEAIQAEGLHPVSLASLLKAHRGSLVRLEVLVDLPGECSVPKDSGRPLSDTELRKLLERAPGTLASSQSSQELNVSTKLVRVALRKPRNVPLPPAEALPASMFPKDWRRVGCGRSGPVRGRRKKDLFCEYAVPVEEDCRRYPNLQVLLLLRPTESHNSKACNPQVEALRRKWPSMVITCGKGCEKKRTQTQRGSRAPKSLADSESKDEIEFYYKSIGRPPQNRGLLENYL